MTSLATLHPQDIVAIQRSATWRAQHERSIRTRPATVRQRVRLARRAWALLLADVIHGLGEGTDEPAVVVTP